VVKPGQIVKVKVLEVDVKRQRIALSMRLDDVAGARPVREAGSSPSVPRTARAGQDAAGRRAPGAREGARAGSGKAPSKGQGQSQGLSAMALAFAQSKKP
jgi:uncharacterized protein